MEWTWPLQCGCLSISVRCAVLGLGLGRSAMVTGLYTQHPLLFTTVWYSHIMFHRVFKKKGDAPCVELTRKSRVEKSRRPRTAPSSTCSSPRWSGTISPDSRHSLPEGTICRRKLSRDHSVAEYDTLHAPSHSRNSITAAALDEYCCPPIDRSASSVSCEIRNPFRSNTSESIQTVSMSRTTTRGSSIESGMLVQRAVPSYYATPIEGSLNPEPCRAAIFTRDIQCTPEASYEECPEDAASPIMPTTPTEGPCQGGKRHHWSFMRSAKLSPDFLRIHIPSGILSPPNRENRNSLWSRT
ncbi:hypothetical protein C8Q80DRAFT_1169071 [Daedaleopsis nitida]|nr:hypothetical protein C8Q80DRAFT_1169071 [Daedaleopsis nitida]